MEKKHYEEYQINNKEWNSYFKSIDCNKNGNYQFAYEGYIPIRDQQITCCLIDSVKNGSRLHINLMRDLISKRTPNSSACYCKKTKSYCVIGKELFETQLQLLQNDRFFECIEDTHGDLFCPAQHFIEELMSAIEGDSNKRKGIYDFISSDQFLSIIEDKCECEKLQLVYSNISNKYANNEIKLRNSNR